MSLASEFKEFAMKGRCHRPGGRCRDRPRLSARLSARSSAMSSCRPSVQLIGNINFSDLALRIGTDPTGKSGAVENTACSFKR